MPDTKQSVRKIEDLIRRYQALRRKNPIDLWNLEFPHKEEYYRHHDEAPLPPRKIPSNVREYIQKALSQKKQHLDTLVN